MINEREMCGGGIFRKLATLLLCVPLFPVVIGFEWLGMRDMGQRHNYDLRKAIHQYWNEVGQELKQKRIRHNNRGGRIV